MADHETKCPDIPTGVLAIPQNEDDLEYVRLGRNTVYDYLSKYGFQDGERVLEEERPICKQEATKLASLLKGHLTDWEPCVIETGHNPFYVCFYKASTGRYVPYYDMEERERRRIDKLVDALIWNIPSSAPNR